MSFFNDDPLMIVWTSRLSLLFGCVGVKPDTGRPGTKPARSRDIPRARVVVAMATAATPWGQAKLLDEVRLSQRAGDKRFASVVQLLEAGGGERLVRFAYATGGVARRGPVTLRARDLERLRSALAEHPDLAAALGL
jgi:hypothetical protein